MEFSPANPIVQLCLRGAALEENKGAGEGSELFLQAWSESTEDLERFISAHFIARSQREASEKLKWFERALRLAQNMNDDSVKSAFPALYSSIAKCHEDLGDPGQVQKYFSLAASYTGGPSDKGPFYHGTKADLRVGDLLTAGKDSNYKPELKMNHVYFTALLHGAALAAELAKGDQRARVYIVKPTGPFEDDPNVTNQKFPGNLTRSYRSQDPLEIVGEASGWARQTPEELEKWQKKLADVKGEIIN